MIAVKMICNCMSVEMCRCVMNFLLLVFHRVQYESKVRESDKSRKISDCATKHDSRYLREVDVTVSVVICTV